MRASRGMHGGRQGVQEEHKEGYRSVGRVLEV